MKRKKIFYATLTLLLLLLIGGSAVLFFRAAARGQASASAVPFRQDNTPQLGELLNLQAICILPWGQTLSAFSFAPQQGFVQSGSLKEQTLDYSLNGRKKLITIPLRSIRTGNLEPGSLTLQIQRPWVKNMPHQLQLSVKLPAIQITQRNIKDKNSLPLADELQKQPQYRNFPLKLSVAVAIMLVVLLTAIYIWSKYRKKYNSEPLPPWVTAQQHIDELRSTAASGSQPLAWCVSRLTDVVRNYLSERFNMPATQQTTGEFFASLKCRKSPLNTSQISYLEDFMSSADLVKFANVRPDRTSFTYAVDRAEELVRETSLSAENSRKNHADQERNNAI